MALRKKKPQQDDSEKLQALLKSWDIQLPETSEKNFPKADFPEPKPAIKLEKETKPKKSIDLDALFGKSKKSEPATLLTGNADLDKMFKQQVIQYLHGTVRMITLTNLSIFLILIFWGVVCLHGITSILSIFCFLGATLWIWYLFSWKLTFNGETNRFSYRSLFHQEIHFHASEIQSCKTERKMSQMLTEVLYLEIYQQTICINLGYLRKRNMKFEQLGGYHNSDKLKEYLDIYQELHGNFSYSGFLPEEKSSDSSSKQELMEMLAQYQKQIDEKNNLDKE
ncbi:MAG: hypothetical protein IKI37_02960 [Oscillospiraceae bacterium]|nr:hypothetical protein [Oscillospiraceae bacterium]MBR7084123.1 hypothetical protein [Oscillospiraceae bacterium]